MLEKINIDYVFSAPKALRVMPTKIYKQDQQYIELRKEIVHKILTRIIDNINSHSKHCHVSLSLLANAYTEQNILRYYNEERYLFKNIYADSGGLQVMTLGYVITDKIKEKIYNHQDLADIGFCLDEIPVSILADIDNKSARTNMTSKIFDYSKFRECAIKTAENVKEQLTYLKKAKVSYIVQGNTYKDMIEWVDIGFGILGEENIKKLHGIALADSCMGNAQLESCDMAYVMNKIYDKYDNLEKNVHLLGVGAATRMLPFIIFNTKNINISADSTSHSMNFTMGNTISMHDKVYNDFDSYKHFVEDIYDILSYYTPGFDIDELANFILKNNRNCPDLENMCHDKNHPYYFIGTIIPFMFNVWTVNDLFNKVNIIYDEDPYLNLLKDTKDENYLEWRSKYHHKIKSNRIKRKRNSLV